SFIGHSHHGLARLQQIRRGGDQAGVALARLAARPSDSAPLHDLHGIMARAGLNFISKATRAMPTGATRPRRTLEGGHAAPPCTPAKSGTRKYSSRAPYGLA